MRKGSVVLLMMAITCLSISAQAIEQKTARPPLKSLKVQTPQIHIQTPKPDLVISNCRFELQGHNVKAYATLKNSGNLGAAFQTGQVMAVLSVLGESRLCIAPGGGYFLGAGQTTEVSPIGFYVASGTYPAKWTANPNHVVDEKDFENNVLECQLVGPAPPSLPDLAITSLSVQPPSGPPGTVFKVVVIVTNQGDATLSPISKCIYTLPYVFLDNVVYPSFVVNWGIYKEMPVGQSITHTLSTTTPLAPGVHTIRAEINRKHELEEKTYNNNTSTCTFTVTQ
jgi:hypothetical protein